MKLEPPIDVKARLVQLLGHEVEVTARRPWVGRATAFKARVPRGAGFSEYTFVSSPVSDDDVKAGWQALVKLVEERGVR